MPSYQDIEMRLKIVEDKLDLVLQCAQVTVGTPSALMPGEVVKKQISLGELYKTLRQSGADLVAVKKDEDGNG
jgi:hypothetical protein